MYKAILDLKSVTQRPPSSSKPLRWIWEPRFMASAEPQSISELLPEPRVKPFPFTQLYKIKQEDLDSSQF